MRMEVLARICDDLNDYLTANIPDYKWTVLPEIEEGCVDLLIFTVQKGTLIAARPSYNLVDIDRLRTDKGYWEGLAYSFKEKLDIETPEDYYPTSYVKVWTLSRNATCPREILD